MDPLYLVRNGVPFDVAFSLEPHERLAWIVVLAGFDGIRYDWEKNSWDRDGG